MKILSVTQNYYPFLSKGGPAIKVRSIARALERLTHQNTVLTADLGLEGISTVHAAPDPLGWRTYRDGVEVVYLRTLFRYRSLTVNPRVRDFCRSRLKEFDIVHIYGLYDLLGLAVGRSCRKLGIPYFVEPLGMTVPIDRGILLKRLWKGLAKSYLDHADKWIATSELERADLLTAGVPAEKILLRPNGIDREDFSVLPAPGAFRKKMGIPADEPVILFLGRLIPRKGADLLLEALAGMGCDNMKLVIAGPEGESGYLAFLRAKAEALGIGPRVVFPGPLYEDAQKEALVDATVFALASRYENFGNTAAEAVACGTPVVVTDRCGIAPLVDQRAGLVTSYNSESLCQTLKKLINDPALYRRLKSGCAAVAEELYWDRLVGGIEDSYEAALNRPLQFEALANPL